MGRKGDEMADYRTIASDLEVSGTSAKAMVEAMRPYDRVVESLLTKHNLGDMRTDSWYPMQVFVELLRVVASDIGENSLFAIGKRVPEVVLWPPDINDIDAGLASIDVAYHMNHRDSKGVLFDPATGTMREGIGHYQFERTGPRSAIMVCSTPYPSELDRGIVTGTARKWKPSADAVLDQSKPTRKSGGESCTYSIEW
jgi:hypothetical protein